MVKPNATSIEVGKYDSLYFIYNNLGYKIHKVGVRNKKLKDDTKPMEVLGKVFYFEKETNLAFQKNNPHLKEKQILDLIITDEDLATFGAVIAE